MLHQVALLIHRNDGLPDDNYRYLVSLSGKRLNLDLTLWADLLTDLPHINFSCFIHLYYRWCRPASEQIKAEPVVEDLLIKVNQW